MTTTTSTRGHVLKVLRPANGYDCTLGGVSSQAAEVTVVGIIDDRTALPGGQAKVAPMPTRLQQRTPAAEAPAVFLRIRAIGSDVVFSIEPATGPDEHRPWCMFGSNYAASGAPEWRALIGGNYGGVIPVHDRVER